MPSFQTKTFVAGQVLAAADLNLIRDDLVLLDQHVHTGAAGDGAARLVSASMIGVQDSVALFMEFPSTQTDFSFSNQGATSTLQNAAITFPVQLRSGTWTLRVSTYNRNNRGIASFDLSGSAIGTLDFYIASAFDTGAQQSITGITVATSGIYTLQAVMATKNAGSGGYQSRFWAWHLVRTGP